MKLLLLFLCLRYVLTASDSTWWKHNTLYEVYIWSFKDSDGDGVGDLKGITQKIDHFTDLLIDTMYISPFFRSPMKDMGYDISNFTEIEPLFGTMQDFDRLMAAAKERNIKVIGDLVINHSSDEHPWFQKSVDRIEPYTDFYVWADPKGYDYEGNPILPNNWLSLFTGSAWEWNNKRKQFYLHQFAVKQPDFNLRSKHLKQEIKNIIKFWFDRGLSGFRLDATKHYVEDELLRDEPPKDLNNKNLNLIYTEMKHIYTTNLWESYVVIHELREFVDDYNKKHNDEHERILIVEAYTNLNRTLAYYGTKDYHIAHFPFDFVFAKLYKYVPAKTLNNMITQWLRDMPTGASPNWMTENHDRARIGTRLGEEYMDILTITIMTLPGVACIYYGQEIGMINYAVRSDQTRDPNNDGFSGATRDGQRLPMQWDNSVNAGFTTNDKTWLPVHPNYWVVNVETQKATKYSRYNMFKTLSSLRKTKTMKKGDFTPYYSQHGCTLTSGTETEIFDLHDAFSNLSSTLKVVTASQNAGYNPGDKITSIPKFPQIFVIRPSSAVVLTTHSHYKQLD